MRKKELNISRTFKVSSAVTALASAAILGVSSFGLIPTKAFDERAFCVEASRIDDPSIRTTNCQAPVPSVSPSPTVSVSSSPNSSTTPPTVPTPTPTPTPVIPIVVVSPLSSLGTGSMSGGGTFGISNDGLRLTGSSGTTIFNSVNGGATWTNPYHPELSQNNSIAGAWKIDASADGKNVIAGRVNDWVWKSSDYGVTWSRSYYSEQLSDVAISGDGKYRLATGSGGSGYIETSMNGSAFAQQYVGMKFSAIAISGNGLKTYLAVGNSIYTSSNGGVNRTKLITSGLGGTVINKIKTSQDGSKLIVISSGEIYTSNDFGLTWQLRQVVSEPTDSKNFVSLAINQDGTKMAAAVSNPTTGFIYTSADSGMTWQKQAAAGLSGWGDIKFYSNDTKLAIAKSSKIYTANLS